MGKKLRGIFNRSVFFVMSIIMSMLLLQGCGGEVTTQTAEEEESLIQPFQAVNEVKEGRKNIYAILKVYNSQYWYDIADGAAKAGDDADCNIYVGANTKESDWESQSVLIKEAVSKGADAIILAPGDSNKLCSLLDEVRSSGIPVILVDTIINSNTGYDTCYMTDNLQAGELAAQEMFYLLKAKGLSSTEPAQIAIHIASTASQTVIDRLAGFNQYWSANAPAAWTVIDEVKTNEGSLDKAKQNTIDLVNEYPDIEGIFGCNNSTTVGTVTALNELDNTNIVLVGFDLADETADMIRSDDHLAATVVQNQYDMGYNGVIQAVNIIETGKSEYKFIDTGVNVVTNKNIDRFQQSKAGEKK